MAGGADVTRADLELAQRIVVLLDQDPGASTRGLTLRSRALARMLRAVADMTGPDAELPPTVREIAAHAGGMSTGTVGHHLPALRRLGLITQPGTPRRARALRLTERGRALIEGAS